jgi:hypothetical protein
MSDALMFYLFMTFCVLMGTMISGLIVITLIYIASVN